MINDIRNLLAELKCKGMLSVLDRLLAQAQKDGAAIQEVIRNLLTAELNYRRERSVQYRLNQAKLPQNWTINTFPFARQPAVDKTRIMTLTGLDFIERGENILFIGPPSVGKSGLATGILRQALISGKKGAFYNVQDLLDDLHASLADRSTPKLLKKLCRYDLLVLDEFGYLTLSTTQMNSFFKLMKQRYEAKRSTIITSNLELGQWYEILTPKDMVTALLDRLQHRCITIRIDGPNLRTPDTA